MSAFGVLGQVEAKISLANYIYKAFTAQSPAVPLDQSGGQWRPVEWSKPALVLLTVPNATNGPYVFDAILRTEHAQELRITEHPVQSGANITDHAYLMQPRVSLEIAMSDAVQSYTSGQWTGNASKSISAFQVMKQIQASRQLVSLTTRQQSYTNLLIEDIQSPDSAETRHGLRMTVNFRGIFLASVTAVSSGISFGNTEPQGIATSTISYGTPGDVSARPQATNATTAGTVQGSEPPPAVVNQYSLFGTTYTVPPFTGVSGAGDWSSNNVSSLAQ